MNAIAALYAETALALANNHIHELQLEAERRRLVAAAGPRSGLWSMVTGAISSVRRGSAAPAPASVVPTLSGYPFGG